MIPPLRHASLLQGVSAALLLTTAGLVLAVSQSGRRAGVPTPPDPAIEDWERATAIAPAPALPRELWAALNPTGDTNAEGALARRFRLAGTLFGFGVGSAEAPQAILDDKLLVEQRLVRRGEEVLPGVRLTHVRTDAVVLEGFNGSEELRIDRGTPSVAPPSTTAAGTHDATSTAATPSERFGAQQVFPGRWEFQRTALINYYAELRNQPERLLAVFDSLEPLYQDNDPTTKTITGYKLNVRGEAPFFDAMGMKPGDVVRSVNSVAMTNRRRAESFIRAFVEEGEDTFAIELERDGVSTKQVYIIR